MKYHNDLKGFFSLVGAFLIHFTIGSFQTWSNLMPYYVSYQHYKTGSTLPISYSSFYIPLITLVYTFFITIGIITTSKVGIYIPCFISTLLLIISHLILYFTTSWILVIIAFNLLGIAIGLVYLSVVLNSWSYYPNKKGRIISLILTGFGVSNLIMDKLANIIINPQNEQIDSESGYYSETIANNILVYIKISIGMIIVLGICGILMITPWTNQIIAEKAQSVNKINNEDYTQLIDLSKTNNDVNNNIHRNVESFYNGGKEDIKLGFKSKPFIQLVSLFLLSSLFNSLHINPNWKFSEQIYLENENFLSNNIFLFNIGNSLFLIVWGILLDNFSFKEIYILSIFIQIIVFSTFYFISEFKYLFYFYNFLTGLSKACSVIVIPFAFYKIFGIKNGGIYFGISQFISALGSLFMPVLIYNLSNKSMIYYLILFLTNSVTKMLAAIILCFIEEKPFDYGRKEKEQFLQNRFSTSSTSSRDSIDSVTTKG